jgi:carnitine-CoA ligase
MLTHGDHTIYTYLQKQARKHQNKPFICCLEEEISYIEMLKRSNQTARWLQKQGIKQGNTVAVMHVNSPLFYDLWFGCAAIGAILLPINTASTARELEYFLDHSESKVFLYDDSLVTASHLEMLDHLPLTIYQNLSKEWVSERSILEDEDHHIDVLPSDVCAMMYTSGTTSKPKGVLITHENYLFAGHSSVVYQGLTPEDRYLIFLPLFHVNSQYYTSMATLVVGGTILLLERFSASTFWEDVQKLNPTVSSFVATIIKILLELPVHPYEKEHSIRQVGYGLFVNKNDIDIFKQRFGIKLFQWYGMTESITTNIVTPLYEEMPADPETGILAIGKPGLGNEIKIVDENSNELPPFTVGQIIIKTLSLMKGYYKNEIETNKTLRNGWLYTGDKGYRNEEGFFWFVDRDKDLIKRAGENISSIEIENVLLSYPGVVDCAVISVPDILREEAIIAFISTNGTNISQEDIRLYCTKELSNFKIPQEFRFVKEFPRTSIGKIQKNILRQNFKDEID